MAPSRVEFDRPSRPRWSSRSEATASVCRLSVRVGLVFGVFVPSSTSLAVMVAVPAVRSVTAKVCVPEVRSAFAGKTAFASVDVIWIVKLAPIPFHGRKSNCRGGLTLEADDAIIASE